MEKVFTLKTGKHTVIKGYTLLEMIIVVSIVSILMLTISMHRFDRLHLQYNMQKLQAFITYTKRKAILLKQQMTIDIDQNKVNTMNDSLELDQNVHCESYTIAFNQKGNVDKGGSFICYYNDAKAKIIVHLGNGDFKVEN